MLSVTALGGIPEVAPGADVAQLIVTALAEQGERLSDADILVLAHKVVSKAEGRIRSLSNVAPSERAIGLAAKLGKDPRHVQVVLDETDEVLRAERGVLICVTRHGFVCANAGVDASNVPGDGEVVLLPSDPDLSARTIRSRLGKLTGARPAVVITERRIDPPSLANVCASPWIS